MGPFPSVLFGCEVLLLASTKFKMRAKWRKKRMRRLKRKRRKMRARSKYTLHPHLQPGSLLGILASASPWNTEESMGRLLSSKTSSNILPEAEHSKGRSFQELCSVLQRDLIHTAVISYIII